MNPTLLALCAAATLAATTSAQSPACEARNDTNISTPGSVTSFSFAGPNSFAWQLTPTANNVVFGGRLVTGNTLISGDKFMSLEIWDDAGGLPGTRLGGGTWQISSPLGISWQGANFDLPVVLNQGQPVWVVWTEPGFSEVPIEAGGVSLPRATLAGGNWSLGGQSALKVRLFCSLLDDANVTVAGAACTGSTGNLATLFTNHLPTLGNQDFAFEGIGLQPGTLTILALGLNSTFPSVPIPGLPAGCNQNTDLATSIFTTAGTGTVAGPTASGHARIPLPIPANGALTGVFVRGQLANLDTALATPLPYSTSNGLSIVVQ